MKECWEGDDSCGEVVEEPRTPPAAAPVVRPRAPSTVATPVGPPSIRKIVRGLSWVDLLLPVWIFSAMVLGVLLSVFVPSARRAFDGDARFVGVAAPLAAGLIVMLVPPFCGVRWEVLPAMLRRRSVINEVAASCALNWLVGPLLMLALAWATLPDLVGYRTGVTLVGLARCIGMVLVWNTIARGDAELCATLVVLNSIAQIALYAPLAVLFVSVISGASAEGIGYGVVARSVGVYLGIPLGAGFAIRAFGVLVVGRERYHARVLPWIAPWALVGLVYTIIVIFTQQGDRAIHHLGPVFRTFAPLAIYFGTMWTGSFFLSRWSTGAWSARKAARARAAAGTRTAWLLRSSGDAGTRAAEPRRSSEETEAPKAEPRRSSVASPLFRSDSTPDSGADETCFCDSVDECRARPAVPLVLAFAEDGEAGPAAGGERVDGALAEPRPGSMEGEVTTDADPKTAEVALREDNGEQAAEEEPHAGSSYAVAVAQAFTAASNNFELSIAVATSVYGASSDQALAATLGALLEVPVLLCLAYVALWLRARLSWRDVGAARPTES